MHRFIGGMGEDAVMADILSVEQEPGGAILVRGEADLSSRWLLSEAIGRCEANPLVVDLSECTFLDSSALAVLIRASQTVELDGRRLVIRNPGRAPRRVIELSGAALVVDG